MEPQGIRKSFNGRVAGTQKAVPRGPYPFRLIAPPFNSTVFPWLIALMMTILHA